MFVCLFICCRFYLIIKKKSAASEKKITAKKKIATTWNRTHDVGFNRHAIQPLNHRALLGYTRSKPSLMSNVILRNVRRVA